MSKEYTVTEAIELVRRSGLSKAAAIDPSQIGGQLTKWWGGLTPGQKNILIGGGTGAVAGGLLGDAVARATGSKHVLSSALLGSLFGGVAGAATPAGYGILKNMKGREKGFMGRTGDAIGRGIGAVGGAAVKHLAAPAVAGGAAAWPLLLKGIGAVPETVKKKMPYHQLARNDIADAWRASAKGGKSPAWTAKLLAKLKGIPGVSRVGRGVTKVPGVVRTAKGVTAPVRGGAHLARFWSQALRGPMRGKLAAIGIPVAMYLAWSFQRQLTGVAK